MARFERVLLYVGAPKTGTTSIQSFLWTNRVELIKQGFFVPKTGRRGAQHMELPATLSVGKRSRGLDRHADIQEETFEARRVQFREALNEELAGAPRCHTLLFMSEYMFSSTRQQVHGYRNFATNYADRLESVMYLRRQDQWLASLSLQTRKSGTRSDLQLNPGAPEKYGGNIRGWDAESDRCHIRRFDAEFLANGNLIEDFCRTTGMDPAPLSTLEVHANPAILQEQLELIDALNEKLAAIAFWRRIPFRRDFIRLCTEILGGTKIEFRRAAAQAVFASFKRINTWLRDTRDPTGPALFFNTDFSSYPEHPKNEARYTDEQLATLAGAIARQYADVGLAAPPRAPAGPRRALIDHIAAIYLPFREAQLAISRRALRATRSAAEQALSYGPDWALDADLGRTFQA